MFKLQQAVRTGDCALFQEYSAMIDDQTEQLCTLRGLFRFREGPPVPLDEVEPEEAIMRRFATGAMSFGSHQQGSARDAGDRHEPHRRAQQHRRGRRGCRALPARPNGDWRRSAIKQVASGRFGVTADYLVNAEELQIKIAQGAKPGEGGQLPGHKVTRSSPACGTRRRASR